jgi:hypothetical protein
LQLSVKEHLSSLSHPRQNSRSLIHLSSPISSLLLFIFSTNALISFNNYENCCKTDPQHNHLTFVQ